MMVLPRTPHETAAELAAGFRHGRAIHLINYHATPSTHRAEYRAQIAACAGRFDSLKDRGIEGLMQGGGARPILAPILFPIAMRLGIDPVHLGIIMVVNLEIGMVTPPIGLNLFVTAGITRMSIGEVVRAALPWSLVLLAFLVIITYVPAITLFLPNLLF